MVAVAVVDRVSDPADLAEEDVSHSARERDPEIAIESESRMSESGRARASVVRSRLWLSNLTTCGPVIGFPAGRVLAGRVLAGILAGRVLAGRAPAGRVLAE